MKVPGSSPGGPIDKFYKLIWKAIWMIEAPDLFQKVNGIVIGYLSKKSFLLKNLEKEISKNSLPFRLAPGYTVFQYLNDLIDERYIACDNNNGRYYRIKKERNPLLDFKGL